MLTIVDMRKVVLSDFAFSVWDSVTDEFLKDTNGEMYWSSFEAFMLAGFSRDVVAQVQRLLVRQSKESSALRSLLVRYIRHVQGCEGVDYIVSGNHHDDDAFTEAEWGLLRDLSAEASAANRLAWGTSVPR